MIRILFKFYATPKNWFIKITSSVIFDVSACHSFTMFGVKSTRVLSVGMTGYQADTKYLFKTPVELDEGNAFIDIDRDAHSIVSLADKNDNERAYMLSSGIVSSSMEHVIFEQMFDTPAVSTIKILQEANSSGVPVYTVTKENIDSMLPKLEVSSTIKTDIHNAVNSGKTVTIPQRNIRYFNWTGTGYVVLDSQTGAAAYMISGGIAGGSVSIKNILIEYVISVVTGAVIIAGLMLMNGLIYSTGSLAVFWGLGIAIVAVEAILTIIYLTFVFDMIMSISDYIRYGDTETLEHIIAQLGALVTIGLFGKVMYEKVSDNMRMMDKLAKQEEEFYKKTADYGYSRETTTDHYQKCGPEQSKNVFYTYKNENVSEQNASRAGRDLNGDGIDTFKDILNDNTGKFNEADHSKILDLLKQCNTKEDMDLLRSSIKKLEEYDIKPADYQSKGIDTPEKVKAVAEAVEETPELVSLYRVVSPEEFYDIIETSTFNIFPKGLDAKQFGLNLQETINFAEKYPDLAAVVEVKIPQNILDEIGDLTIVDGFNFKAGTVTINADKLDIFNQFIHSIAHVY